MLHVVGLVRQTFIQVQDDLRGPLRYVSYYLVADFPVLLLEILDVVLVGVVVPDSAKAIACPFVQLALPFLDGKLLQPLHVLLDQVLVLDLDDEVYDIT